MEKNNTNVFELTDTIKAWDNDYYHPISEQYYDRAIVKMLELMRINEGALVLDAGCGPGVHSLRVAQQKYQVLAIDISKTMLTEAQLRVEQSGFNNSVSFQQEDLTRLSFPDASFEYVFSWGVIIHIEDIEKALDELARIVKPGGKLALYVTNKKALDHSLESLARFLLGKAFPKTQNAPMGVGISYDFKGENLWLWQIDTDAMTEYLKKLGLVKTHHIIGEFTEIQRWVKGTFRKALLHFNNFCYSSNLPPNLARTNLLIFEKVQEID